MNPTIYYQNVIILLWLSCCSFSIDLVIPDGQKALYNTKQSGKDAGAISGTQFTELVSIGTFRHELFYRLNVVKLMLPPLSNLREDIPLLVEHFIQNFNARKAVKSSAAIVGEGADMYV